jgi:uncharacterized membrane protein YeaQ/YmgE (transglycosylase-associated protein family)
VVAMLGAVVSGFILAGFQIIGRHDLDISAAFEAIPGAIIALTASWYYGRSLEQQQRRKRRHRPARA